MKLLLFLVLCEAVSCYGTIREHCQITTLSEDVNWERLSKVHVTWWDSMKSKVNKVSTDCYHWYNFTKMNKGFSVDVDMKNYGTAEILKIKFAGIRRSKGVYLMDENFKTPYLLKQLESIKKIDEKNKDEIMTKRTDDIFEDDYIYLTDYESYFLIVRCSEKGWRVWAKTSEPIPTRTTMVKMWKAMYHYQILVPLEFSKCVTKKCQEL